MTQPSSKHTPCVGAMKEARWRTHSSQRANPLGCEWERSEVESQRRDKIRFLDVQLCDYPAWRAMPHHSEGFTLGSLCRPLLFFSLFASSVSPLPSSVLIFPLWNVESISG